MPGRSQLDPEKWERAVEIFERALELPRESRESLLVAESAGDSELAETVRGMLAADSSDAEMIDRGIDGVADIAAASIPDHPLRLGDVLGNFEVIGELGRGGMGIVYAARDRHLGRIAALKLLPARSAQDPTAMDRLLAEAQAASALDHPNVATIYQVGEHEGQRFIAMARYEGETLRDRLARGPVPLDEAVAITKQVAEGLAAAHGTGLVHRDVKPANIFLTRQGLVKLLDFGIATLIGPDDADATTP
jgi:serine/threonine-protein kinase